MAKQVKPYVILIIGAGSTGLALAAGFQKNGIKALVFEKDASLTEKSRDWNMGLHWGAAVLRGLLPDTAWERLQSVQVDPNVPTKVLDSMYFLNSQTGERIGAAEIDNFYRLKRSKLRALLAENLGIRFEKKLAAIEYSADRTTVTAKFEDGSSETGTMIVGADGARSVTRNLIVGLDSSASCRIPYAATFAQASFTQEQAIQLRSFHALYLAGIHPDGYFSFFGMQDATDAEKPETWIFFFYISFGSTLEEQDKMAQWSNAEKLRLVKQKARQYADPWKSAYEWLPDDHPVWYMGFTDWDPGAEGHHWDNHGGLVTLAGDAAHTMTYQRGQGLNHSITDASKIVKAVKSVISREKSQEEAIKIYEEEMICRAGNEVRMSTQNTAMLHNWEQVLQSPLMRRGLKKD
ncbi:putative monooxygenase [Tothia fuscella]|uniref:Monooxygenase n=1 Tax=Tothia fuscella TaxID=1048955 RepID=A0A9P4P332_9PEZI|nr:putative monooxygenase [Tothia fuscella]